MTVSRETKRWRKLSTGRHSMFRIFIHEHFYAYNIWRWCQDYYHLSRGGWMDRFASADDTCTRRILRFGGCLLRESLHDDVWLLRVPPHSWISFVNSLLYPYCEDSIFYDDDDEDYKQKEQPMHHAFDDRQQPNYTMTTLLCFTHKQEGATANHSFLHNYVAVLDGGTQRMIVQKNYTWTTFLQKDEISLILWDWGIRRIITTHQNFADHSDFIHMDSSSSPALALTVGGPAGNCRGTSRRSSFGRVRYPSPWG